MRRKQLNLTDWGSLGE
ncbi:hypothetical protein [Vibrio cholerae]